MRYDVMLFSFPNKNMDYPGLALPTLTAHLLKAFVLCSNTSEFWSRSIMAFKLRQPLTFQFIQPQ